METNIWLWFSGVKMYLITGSSVKYYPSVSGKATLNNNQDGMRKVARFQYSQSLQKAKNVGPLPSGRYFVTTGSIIKYAHTGATYRDAVLAMLLLNNPQSYLEDMNNAWGKMQNSTGQIIPIFSQNGTKEYAYSRNNAWIHGSHSPGSIGCIDMMSNMDAFIRALEKAVPSPTTKIPLKVLYGLGPDGLEPREIDRHWNDVSRIA